jgi:two-component system, LytTR family, sensor kinase
MVFKFRKNVSELGFWHYQFLGFGLFLFNDLLRSVDFFSTPWGTVVYLAYLYSILFGLTLLSRYIYRPLYKLRKSQLFYFVVISAVSFLLSALSVELRFILRYPLTGTGESWLHLKRNFQYLTMILTSSWVFFVWGILYFSIKYWQDLNREYERTRASLLLASKAQLQMLRYQINPHFLFNSLNSIQGLMYQDLKKADLMLTELSEFLRYTLKFNTDIYVCLEDEFEIIEKYLFVEKIRFDDRLDYSIHVPSDLRKEKILCFLTQPFVENAIKHGMKSSPYNKIEIVVEASVDGPNLVIIVTNTGKWKENEGDDTTGIKNVKERLDNAYPGNYSLNISDETGLVKVEIKVPRNE